MSLSLVREKIVKINQKTQIVISLKLKIVNLAINWLIFIIKNSELRTEDRICTRKIIGALIKGACKI